MEQASKDPNDLVKDLISMRCEGSHCIAEIYRKDTKMIIKASKQQKVPHNFEIEEQRAPELFHKLGEIKQWNSEKAEEKILLAKVLKLKNVDPVWSHISNGQNGN